MDLEGLGFAIGFAHAVVYMAMLAIFTTATLGERDFGLIAVYITMAVLSVAESVAGCCFIAAIIEKKSVYMLPMLIVTPITATVGMFDAVAVFPYGRMATTITISILSVISLVPVYTLYRKYKSGPALPQVNGITENSPLNTPEIIATAPPPPPQSESYVPANNNTDDEILDGEPPSYGAVMARTAALPYPPKSAYVGVIDDLSNPVAGPGASSFGWRSDLGQDVSKK